MLNKEQAWQVLREAELIHDEDTVNRAVRRLVGMVRTGQISLDGFGVTEFPLEQVNEAVAHAAANAGPFNMTVVTP